MTLTKALARAVELSSAPKRKHKGGKFLKFVDVADFLESLEIENVHQAKSDELVFSCPFDGHTAGDAKPSAYMNTGAKDASKATIWQCFGCTRSGNGVSFLSELQGISKHEATIFIKQTWAPGFRAPKGGSISVEFEDRLIERWEKAHTVDKIKTIPWQRYEDLFGVDWVSARTQYEAEDCDPAVAYLFDRGFTASTLTRWRIGFDVHGRNWRLTIPVSNIDGELVGVKARAYEDDVKPKYLILGDRENRRPRYGFMPYEKSLVVYGLDKAKKKTTLVLVEGELDVVALDQVGQAGVSTGSAHLSVAQARLIRDYADEIIVYFDNDNAGHNATWGWEDRDGCWHPGLVERLAPFLRIRVVVEPEHDPAQFVSLGRAYEMNKLIDNAPSHLRLIT